MTTPSVPASQPSGQSAEVTHVLVPGMDCAAEEAEIRRALEPVTGISSLSFQLGIRTLLIWAPPDALQGALQALRTAGFSPQVVAATSAAPGTDRFAGLTAEGIRLLGAVALAIAAELVAYFGGEGRPMVVLQFALAAAAIGLSGIETYRKGLSALLRGRLNINALMTVAVTGAFVIGEWPEAAMVMALYSVAELIEARAVDRARNAIKTLMALAPDQAEVQGPEGSWTTRPAADVALGAIIRVRPGARLPLDGTVSKGSTAVNQAPVTGESLPVEKNVGDPVFAATINETGEIEVKVTAVASNSTLSRIIHAVEQAQGSRAPTQRFVDRFASIYTPAVFLLAVVVAIGAPLLLGWTWLAALYKALVLLVVACPCALVISTPVTVVSALASAARRGILIKGGAYLEQARKLAVIALDKTGTITEGKPRLVEFVATNPAAMPESQVRALAASLAARSDHPVSRAIAAALEAETRSEVTAFSALAGRGVQGTIDGRPFVLGNHRLMEERNLCGAKLEALLKTHEDRGRTVTLLASETAVLGLFAVADTIKESSRTAMAELRQLNVGTVMLTGDNPATANFIAAQAGIDDAKGNLLPEDKLTAIRELQQRGGLTGMTGDGINDAPALAAADIGIAMGGAGTDTAIEAADIVVMNDDLRRIPETIVLSRRTHAILLQNITLAIGIKAVFLVLTIAGQTSMWMAVFADMGASLLVVANGLRLLGTRPRDE